MAISKRRKILIPGEKEVLYSIVPLTFLPGMFTILIGLDNRLSHLQQQLFWLKVGFFSAVEFSKANTRLIFIPSWGMGL